MKRLDVIASMIEPCSVFADIGCDHGIISLYVQKNKLAERVCACDASEACLNKAKKLLSNYRTEFFVGDGFVPLEQAGITADQVVIAGMGGELIIKILKACTYKPDLVLGAQKNTDKLRAFLIGRGYKIIKDVKVEENGKFYDIIRAESGESEPLCEIQEKMGVFYKTPNPDLLAYCNFTEQKLKNYKQTDENRKTAELVREVKKWQL